MKLREVRKKNDTQQHTNQHKTALNTRHDISETKACTHRIVLSIDVLAMKLNTRKRNEMK